MDHFFGDLFSGDHFSRGSFFSGPFFRRYNSNPKTIGKSIGSRLGTISRRLHAIGKIQKEGKWVPYELKERDIERRISTHEIFFDRFERKSFLHRIVTGDEKWIYFDNPKLKKLWVDPGQPSTSQPVRNIHEKKALLCVWWNQKGTVYYELLKPDETVTMMIATNNN